MTHDDASDREQEDPDLEQNEETSQADRARVPIDPYIFQSLIPFQDLQRNIASTAFSGLRAAREAAAAFAFEVSGLPKLQSDLQRYLGNSIDFAGLVNRQDIAAAARSNLEVLKSIADASLSSRKTLESIADASLSSRRMLESLAGSLNIDALTNANALLSAASFPTMTAAQTVLADTLNAHTQEWLRSFHTIDFEKLVEGLDRWLPENLRGELDLEAVASIALDEGIPLCWIPRTEIVRSLLDACTPEDRLTMLDNYRDEIVDDCAEKLADVPHQWARECEEAIAALRIPLDGPAQSHAAGIIDSIVLCTLGARGRELAKSRAKEDWEDLAIRVAGENLVLRPLYRALVTWFPNNGTPIPDHFARHPTAHAVGQRGLFQARHALIAVMLAVSLTAQFWDDPAAADGIMPEDQEDGSGSS